MQEFLTYIKQEIKKKITLESNKEEIIDSKIISILKKEKNYNTNETKCNFIIMYTALYFNNLELLNYLNKNNFSFGIYPNNLSIYLLDNSFTKYFTNSKFLIFITKYKPYLHSFFLSIKDLKASEKEQYIKRFIYLVMIIDNTLNKYKLSVNSLFTKASLDTFSNETYLCANYNQLNNIIASLFNTPSKGTIKRLNNLIITTNFAMHFHNYDLMFELFSDEELLNMTVSPEYFFTKALAHKLDTTRVLYIFKHNPDIINNLGILNENIFNSYDNDEIIYLSKNINFYSSTASKDLKNYNRKRRVLSLLHSWTK